LRLVTARYARHPAAVLALLSMGLGGCTTAVSSTERSDALLAVTTPVEASEEGDACPPQADDAEVADLDGVRTSLEGLAAGLRDADPDAMRPWLLEPDGTTGTRWQERASNLAAVPLGSYELTLAPDVPALTTARVRERWGQDAQLLLVVEEHTLEGHDVDGPVRDQLVLTLVPRDGRWLLADDRGGGTLGLVRGVQLWDLGPVETARRGDLLALHRPGAGGIDRLLAESAAALELARERWPLPWSERVPLLVPADEEELRELLNVTFELDEFVAFATATPLVEPGEHRLTGSRVVLNPERFDGRDERTRGYVLVHELLHVAGRPYSTSSTPLWLEEGVAQVLGEQRSSTGTRLLQEAGPDGRRLPADAEFTTGGRDSIHLAYQRAWSFSDHLVDRSGAEAFARFYERVGIGSARDPGTVPYRVDQAAREVLGAPIDQLVSDWRAAG
jgi:hypothetical protein